MCNFALAFTVLLVFVYLTVPYDTPCPNMLAHVFTAPIKHVSVWHLICNVWCWLSFAFLTRVKRWEVPAAYGISVFVFILYYLADKQNIVGLSGFLFALCGLHSPVLGFHRGFWTFSLRIIICCIITYFLFPQVAATVHLTCFAIGCLIHHLVWMIRIIRIYLKYKYAYD